MKIVACIFAILSGIFGLFGSTFQSLFGAGMSVLDEQTGNATTRSGAFAFLVSWLIIILGGLALRYPKFSGICLIFLGVIAFFLGNIFSAPFSIIAGIFGVLASARTETTLQTRPLTQSQQGISESFTGQQYASVIEELGKIVALKEKGVISDAVFESEKQRLNRILENSILSKQLPNEIQSDNAVPDIDITTHGGEYEILFARRNWWQRNKWLSITAILSVGVVALLFVYSSHRRPEELYATEFTTYPDYIEGCSCTFSLSQTGLKSNKFILAYNYSNAFFIKDGVANRLMKDETLSSFEEATLITTEVYTSEKYKLIVKTVQTKPIGDERTLNDGSMTIIDNKTGISKVLAIVGRCGC